MKTGLIFLLVALLAFSGEKTGDDVLREMHTRYAGKWYRSFTFTQVTEHYKNDSIVKIATWHEAILFPDKFRIDFGDQKDSNTVIYLKDSVYSFRKGKLVRKAYNDDNLTFLLGGMYSYSLDSVKAKIRKQGYDTRKFYEDKWQGQPVYVIGAASSSEKTNQLWIDQEKLVVLKFIKYKDGEKEEGIFSGHRRFGNTWSETACDFYVNDKLIQKEKYNDCKADADIDPAIFDPYHYREMGF